MLRAHCGMGKGCREKRAEGALQDAERPHLRGEGSPFLPPGDGGTRHTRSPAVQSHGAAFVDLGPLWAHLDPGHIAPCRQRP